ncbi:hypothetical protein MHU86_24647 [Fragilaria crotonensis]|nr:hypothetical protein MHU86_24647 [Fragilaria crotonensis]
MMPTSLRKSNSKKLEPLKFVGGSKFMKELQRTVFFAAYDSVVFRSASSVTDKEQRELLCKSILGSGDPDELTLPEQMVLGINQFGHLYEDVPVTVNDDRNVQSANKKSTEAALPTSLLSQNEYDKRLKDCFFPQKTSGGMLSIYANKPDGITRSLLTSKNFTNPVDVSVLTMMRGAKEVLKNGRKALACAMDSDSDYKDGTLPSGKSIDDYHRFIRERMYVRLRGSTSFGDDDAADDDVFSDNETPTNARREDQQDFDNQADVAVSDKMPEDWYFPGMLAFFLWGFIVENEECAIYKSKQFQIGDSRPDEKGMNSRKQVRKECARAVKKERDTGAALPQSPFRRGATLSQQIEMAKLHAARSMEERRTLHNDYTTAVANIQSEIDTRMEFAKMWEVKDRNDSIFLEIQELMNQKRALTAQFQERKDSLSVRHRDANDMINGVLGGGINTTNKRQKSSSDSSSISTSTIAHGTGFLTPASSTAAPKESVSQDGNNEHKEEYADCTYNIREHFQPPLPLVFPTVDDDNDADE